MSPHQNIFDAFGSKLPGNWHWFTLRAFYESHGVTYMLDYGLTPDRNVLKNSDVSIDIQRDMFELRERIAPHPLPQFTHIELTFNNNGEFESILGYGEPNRDILPRPWPDDITAESYTYTKSWPDGVHEKRAALMKDPRSIVGVRIIADS